MNSHPGERPPLIKFPLAERRKSLNLGSMCNCYQLKPGIEKRFGAGSLLVRPTTIAPVVLANDTLKEMRWGFERPWAKAINNARVERRHDRMWRHGWEKHHCLIPLSGWYEFTGETGNMTCHLLQSQSGGILYAAGLWEEDARHGPCFTMLMTESTGMMTAIHTRMPIILNAADGQTFCNHTMDHIAPSPELQFTDSIVPSPLKKPPKPPPTSSQGELF